MFSLIWAWTNSWVNNRRQWFETLLYSLWHHCDGGIKPSQEIFDTSISKISLKLTYFKPIQPLPPGASKLTCSADPLPPPIIDFILCCCPLVLNLRQLILYLYILSMMLWSSDLRPRPAGLARPRQAYHVVAQPCVGIRMSGGCAELPHHSAGGMQL